MSEFKWHKPEDELPEFGEGDYLLMGKRGALYVACEFKPYSYDPARAYFYVQNNRSMFLDVKKVKAWAEIPKYGGGGRMTHTDDVPTLHEIVDLAEDFNTAMESDDRAAAKSFFALMEHSTIELHTYLVALDLVRDYWGQLANGGDV